MLTDIEILQNKITAAQQYKSSLLSNLAAQAAETNLAVNNYDVQIAALQAALQPDDNSGITSNNKGT